MSVTKVGSEAADNPTLELVSRCYVPGTRHIDHLTVRLKFSGKLLARLELGNFFCLDLDLLAREGIASHPGSSL